MPNYRELLQQARSEISEIDATQARDRIDSGEPVVVDYVRLNIDATA